MILAGKIEEFGEKPAPVTNPTWIDPGANPGLRGERPATNRLSYGTAFKYDYCDQTKTNEMCEAYSACGK
jgi:hypothetical protein